ncbi:hypothetical protein [Noviherbaspirillum sp. ST9]|uniref:hypothetical protein n=1 Tax=Noviherbaspirillum sp. ST9 TaxID=3401606 RepID=UPI003B5891BE
MKLPKHLRFFAALLAMVSVLFSQLAIAAYVCPSVADGQAQHALAAMQAMSEHHDASACNDMDDTQSSLCRTHCQGDNQSVERPQPPNVTPSVAVILVPEVRSADIAFRPIHTQAVSFWLTRMSSPPLSIRNCCFRI